MDIFLRRTEVERITGLSRSEIYRRIADDEFPQPIQLGKRAVAWSQIAIEQWQEMASFDNLFNLEGGILAWADRIDPEMKKY